MITTRYLLSFRQKHAHLSSHQHVYFFRSGRWASLMQLRCLRFFAHTATPLLQSCLRHDRTAEGA